MLHQMPARTCFTLTKTYTDTWHKHAVTGLSNGSSFQYDANGDMVVRIEQGVTYTQTWDTDNRLVDVLSGTQHTQYYYDADGQRMKRVTPLVVDEEVRYFRRRTWSGIIQRGTNSSSESQ